MADDTPEVETLAEQFARFGIAVGENESTESTIVFLSSSLMDALAGGACPGRARQLLTTPNPVAALAPVLELENQAVVTPATHPPSIPAGGGKARRKRATI